jgi:ligand-binding sensor domain-containing protein
VAAGTAFIIAASASAAWCAIGQSAVITLVMPPGARATGMGEAFTGLADDANAVYYNPAGLGQDPLANSWKAFLRDEGPFIAVASHAKSSVFSSQLVWAATPKGILRYTGKGWESSETYLVEAEQGNDLKSIARRYLNVDDDKSISEAAWKIRVENKIEMKRFRAIQAELHTGLADSLLARHKTTPDALARSFLELLPADRTAAKIYLALTPFTDSTAADRMADQIETLLKKSDVELTDLVELQIPFSIAVSDSVTAMAMDESDRLWVGTTRGLWKCSESKWSRVTTTEGLPSNFITSIGLGKYGDLAVGTDAGVGVYKDGNWMKIGTADGLTELMITSVALGTDSNTVLYAGTAKGVFKCTNLTRPAITLIDSTRGLLSNHVKALYYDSQDRLWVGGENGIAIFTGKLWKRFKFPGSMVQCFAEQSDGTIWIGTNKGVVTYTEGSEVITSGGQAGERVPEWKAYHSKNVLSGDVVGGLAPFGNDMWVVTDQAINKYEWAQKQALLFYEQLLPAFRLSDLWHMFATFVYPTEEWGTVAGSINFVNMGTNTITNELGQVTGSLQSYEAVMGLSYGLSFSQTLSMGLNLKYAYSALAPGFEGGGVGSTFAVDVGILKREFLTKNLSLGFMLQNMGPAVYYTTPDQKDPIPFTLRLGTCYQAIQTPVNDVKVLFDCDREVVTNNGDGNPPPFYSALWSDLIHDTTWGETTPAEQLQEVVYHLGVEYWYSHFLALRTGFLCDVAGERYEWDFGLGLNYGNMNFDWSYIYSPDGFFSGVVQAFNPAEQGSSGARDGQMRFSFLFKL